MGGAKRELNGFTGRPAYRADIMHMAFVIGVVRTVRKRLKSCSYINGPGTEIPISRAKMTIMSFVMGLVYTSGSVEPTKVPAAWIARRSRLSHPVLVVCSYTFSSLFVVFA